MSRLFARFTEHMRAGIGAFWGNNRARNSPSPLLDYAGGVKRCDDAARKWSIADGSKLAGVFQEPRG